MPTDNNPVFVKIDKYKEITDILDVVDKKINGVHQILAELEEMKQREDQEIHMWEKNVEEISQKIANIKSEFIL